MASVRVNMRMPADLWAAVGAYAEQRGSNYTAVVVSALRAFLDDARVPELEEASAHDRESGGSGRERAVKAPRAKSPAPERSRGAEPQPAAPASPRAPVEERRFCPHGCGRVFKADKSYCDGCGRDYESGEDVFAEFRGR